VCGLADRINDAPSLQAETLFNLPEAFSGVAGAGNTTADVDSFSHFFLLSFLVRIKADIK
jgi:hypothetical protein